MKELSIEQRQIIEEAGKDELWMAKLRAAAAWEDYAKLLAEKGIEAPEDLKATFEAGKGNKTGELSDDDMEGVSGGWTNIFSCPAQYHEFLCEMTYCPHIKARPYPLNEDYCEVYCDQGYWTVPRPRYRF